MQAVLLGAREVGFTVLSMSLSLIAVFIPILLMGGIVGRYFREFSITLSVAILVSLLVSLTTTPMMCSRLLRHEPDRKPGRFFEYSERAFNAMRGLYERTLKSALAAPALMMFILLVTVCLNIFLYIQIPKGFFPSEDTGRLIGGVQADQSISFQAMSQKMVELMKIVKADPAVANVAGFTGGGQRNGGFMFAALKPLAERKLSTDAVIARLRPKLATVSGASLFLQGAQDIRVGGRQSNATYQYTLQSDSLDDLRKWAPKISDALQKVPELADVNSDQQDHGLETALMFDRATASRLGVTTQAIDSVLNDAFGQRQASVIYNALNQYHVIMEVAPEFLQNPETLKDIYVQNRTGGMVPLMAFATYGLGSTPLTVNHQGQFVASTISFNLAEGVSLGQAQDAITREMARVGAPPTIHGGFQGTARQAQQSLGSLPWLILTALLTIYIVLGVLYESYVHPLTILSTLPSAGVGALMALLVCRTEFSSDRVHRRDAADRHRQEECDHDDRLRARRRAHAGPVGARRCLSGLHPALSSDHDDDIRSNARFTAAGVRFRRGQRNAPAARHLDPRWPARQPAADLVHHAGRLPVSRALPPVVQAQVGTLLPSARRCAAAGGRMSMRMSHE